MNATEKVYEELNDTRAAMNILMDLVVKELGELKLITVQDKPKAEILFKADEIIEKINDARK